MLKNKRTKSSISRKLLGQMSLAVALALLLSNLAVIHFSRQLMLEKMTQELTVLAKLTAMNSLAAVMFEDINGIKQMLENLKTDPAIISAALYNADGKRLGLYRQPDAAAPDRAPTEGTQVSADRIEVSLPLRSDNEIVGHVYIASDTRQLNHLMQQLIQVLGLINLAVLVLTIVFASYLQRRVTRPIQKLTELIQSIIQSRDYQQRAEFSSNDEIGTLIDGFNRFMAEIQSRDRILQENNQQLAQARQEAVEASEAKGRFLANMSHEIRTPMNGVLGMLELLADTPLQDEQQEYARTARNSAFALLDVINDILDFSKIEAGCLEIEKIATEIRPLCEDVAALLAEKAFDKDIELSCFVHSDVPKVILSDPTRLRQVLLNLVGNAVKFTSQGEITLQVLRLEQISTQQVLLKFSVQDSGIGIAKEKQAKLFEAFSQADASTTRQFGGTGLGLSISRQLVELMGGAIHLDSQPGEGSDFWFTLPTEVVEQYQPEPILNDVGGYHVLIVDDNATNRMILEHYCQNWRLHYHSYSSAEDALEALPDSRFDAAIVDYQMPFMDGLQLAAAIHQQTGFEHLPCLLLSSSDHIKEHPDIAVCMMKPVRQSLLFKSLVKLISREVTSTGPVQQTVLPHFEARILLVDDNEINQKVAGRFLQKLGVQVVFAQNGEQALQSINEQDFDLVFMDCHMPVMDGYQATRMLRQWELKNHLPRLPVVAMTANVLSCDKEKCLQAGMDDYLSKPIVMQDVVTVLKRWIAELMTGESVVAPQIVAEVQDGEGFEAVIRQNAGRLAMAEEDYQVLLQDFYANEKGCVERLDKLLAQTDRQAALNEIHRIKGVVGNLGFHELFSLSGQVENSLRQAISQEQAKQVVQALFQALRELLDNINALLERAPDIGELFTTDSAEQVVTRLQRYLLRQSHLAYPEARKLAFLLKSTPEQEAVFMIIRAIEQLNYQQALKQLSPLQQRLFRRELS